MDSADPQVGDKKISFKARVARGAKGWIGAEIQDGSHAFQARIPLGKPNPAVPAAIWKMPPLKDMDSFQPDRPPLAAEAGKPWPTAAVAISPDSVVLVEFENADDRVALRLDGVEVLSLEYDSGSEMPKGPEDNGLFILAGEGATCDMESVRVFRDISYTEGDARMVFGTNGRPLVLGAADQGGEDQYFACGDNSPASSDGRFWGPVPARNLMGRALLVFWPLWPTNWQFKFIR